ncbi:MAG TPA: transcriptional repressor [Gaiellaceae bacterium]|nr:transcriptional repressor [Gaiellaceae bacterium]
MTVTWQDRALAARQSGRARRAIVELLARQSCCVTAQEIFDLLRSAGSAVGLASIYRTLDQLSTDGFVQKIELGDGTTRYEPAQIGGHHHHHVVCDNCGKVNAFEDDRLEQALRRVERRTGFEVAAHDVVLRGTCGDCV